MNLFLAVNAGSKFGAKMAKLEYSPRGAKREVVLVGKGLVFDSGGLCLKRSEAIYTMKTDMAGAASMLAVFNAVVALGIKIKLTVLLGITDNAISNHAIYPDSIVYARNGKTVEILNTDAEGRLVLADLLNYASSLKPDLIIDAATLTGAVVAALGKEVCGVLGNNQLWIDKFIKTANSCDELVWQLPIFDIYRKDMESSVADIRNISKSGTAGCQKAAAFLSEFVSRDWIHLDIAGTSFDQDLPYTHKGAASGLMIRTLVKFLSENI
jgi:leucyl aminopeptidase